jgi:hypothetical protein
VLQTFAENNGWKPLKFSGRISQRKSNRMNPLRQSSWSVSPRNILSVVFGIGLGLMIAVFLGELLVRAGLSLRTSRIEASAQVEGPFMEYHPIRGFALVPNANTHMAATEYDVPVNINHAGLRMDRDIPEARTPGVPRILFLGDSFTFGHGIDAPHRFTDVIQQAWPEAEILNFGVSGTGTDQELLHYREQGVHYSPDLVVLGFYVKCAKRNGDLAIRTPRGWRPKPRFEIQDGQLVLTHVPVPNSLISDPTELEPLGSHQGAIASTKHFLNNHSRLYVFVRDDLKGGLHPGRSGGIYPEYDSARPEWQVTAAIVKELATEVRARGSRFAVAFFPSLEEMHRGVSTRPRDQMRSLCAELDIPFLDLLPIFLEQQNEAEKVGKTLYFPIDQHWTIAGHALAAQVLLPWVKSQLNTPLPVAETVESHGEMVLSP